MINYLRLFLKWFKKLRLILCAVLLISFLTYLRSNSNARDVDVLGKNTDLIFSPELSYRPIYNVIEQSYGLENFSKLTNSEKCMNYFEILLKDNPNWWVSPKRGAEYTHDNLQMNQDLVHMNIFNHCFMDMDNSFIYERLEKNFDHLDTRIYPYLSKKMPLFQHWNGQLFYGPPGETHFKENEDILNPTIYMYYSKEITDEKLSVPKTDQPFWKIYKNNLHGTGIVISINDALVDEAVSLIGNLRTLENILPIQFIHRGDLSASNKYKLVKAARSDISDLIKQEIWFVDISFSLSANYKDDFPKFFNKMLAYGFSSFQKMILLDTDVVLFQNPSDFFSTSQFKESNTLFFKDRNLDMHMSEGFINFLQNTSPNKIDEYLFGMKSVNEETWQGEYFQERYFHYMESGVVVIDREKYWSGVILSLHLSFIQSTIIGSYGDKEHFWIGLLLSGLDGYKFDDYWTASVGSVTKDNSNVKYHKICSSHPSHILSDNNELSWMNSGILNCPKVSESVVLKDFNVIRESSATGLKFNKLEDLETYYKNIVSFEAFIIPPLAKFDISNKNLVDDIFSNMGQEKLNLCQGYIWCSFDTIGNGKTSGSRGIYKSFSNDQIKRYSHIAESYINFIFI